MKAKSINNKFYYEFVLEFAVERDVV